MIKLQDFARQCGVTDRAIQKHLKNHEAHLEGHFQRRGKNGTWLDETAQEYIRSLMIQQPIVVGDARQREDLDAAEARIEQLERENSTLKDKLILVMEQLQSQQALINANAEARLALETAEGEKRILEGFVADAKAEIVTLTEEKAQESVKARQAAQEAEEKERVAQELRRKLEASEARERALRAVRAFYEQPWWKRIGQKPPVVPELPEE